MRSATAAGVGVTLGAMRVRNFVALARRRQYRHVVLSLGFRFDVNAVVVAGVARRMDCDRIPRELPPDAVWISAMGVHRTERCP